MTSAPKTVQQQKINKAKKPQGLAWAIAGMGCLLLAGLLSHVAWRQRPAAAQAELLGVEPVALSEVYSELEPGEFAGTLMLAGMRGLVADMLWLRAIAAKDEGRYYESVALFQLLARLQPHFEQVWEFLSHDLAYNIAHHMPTSEDKYAWFLAGIEANARGCMRNPRSYRLMRHMAWMMYHRGAKFSQRVADDDFSAWLAPLLARHGLEPFYDMAMTQRPHLGDQLDLPPSALLDGRFAIYDSNGTIAELIVIGGHIRDITWHAESASSDSAPPSNWRLRPVYGPYRLAGWGYQAALRVYALTDTIPGTFVRRFVAVAPGAQSQADFNRGDHLLAALGILESLAEWEDIRAWTEANAAELSEVVLEVSIDSYLRHNADLLGRLTQLLPELAPTLDRADDVMACLRVKDFAQARSIMRQPDWQLAGAGAGGIDWWDE